MIIPPKTLLPNKVTFTGAGGRAYVLGGYDSTYGTRLQKTHLYRQKGETFWSSSMGSLVYSMLLKLEGIFMKKEGYTK